MAEIETICCKKLELVTPEYARSLGLEVDKPVFTASNDAKYHIYEVGKTLKEEGFFDPLDTGSVHDAENIGENIAVLHSHVRQGFGYHEKSRFVLINDCLNWLDTMGENWIAMVDPVGEVVVHEDYFFAFNRITNEMRVKEILAYCRGCRTALTEGVIAGNGNGFLWAICSVEAHLETFTEKIEWARGKFLPPWALPEWKFKIDELNGVVLEHS